METKTRALFSIYDFFIQGCDYIVVARPPMFRVGTYVLYPSIASPICKSKWSISVVCGDFIHRRVAFRTMERWSMRGEANYFRMCVEFPDQEAESRAYPYYESVAFSRKPDWVTGGLSCEGVLVLRIVSVVIAASVQVVAPIAIPVMLSVAFSVSVLVSAVVPFACSFVVQVYVPVT